MISIVDNNDSRAVRNLNNLLGFYDTLLVSKDPAGAARKYLAADYIQHNPVVEDGQEGFVRFFTRVVSEFHEARVTIHRIIAAGDYVWAHCHYRNILTGDPDDRGFAVVDIWRLDSEGIAVEHWDALQVVGDQTDAAPWAAPGLPAANANGLF